jgi:CRISPR-associated protein Cmr6
MPMVRPLYRELSAKGSLDLTSYSGWNVGLRFDKFCDAWKESGAKLTLEAEKSTSPKLEWLNGFTKQAVGENSLLCEAHQRRLKFLERQGTEPRYFRTESRFVTGLGREHPIDNGFGWHHSLGVPYLPGSSVKGLVRAWAEQWLGSTDAERIFGPDGSIVQAALAAGTVIFLDALPIVPVCLEADIMTPHYAEYYQDPEHKPPADWYSPIPIPFLTVAPNTIFQFGLVSTSANGNEDLAQVYLWLPEALEVIGAGAKTAVGYGRMVPDANETRKYTQAKQEAETRARESEERERWRLMSGEQRQIEELRKLKLDKATKTDDKRRQAMFEKREKLLRAASNWTSLHDRTDAADLLESVYKDFGWGSDEKKQFRELQLARLRQTNDADKS